MRRYSDPARDRHKTIQRVHVAFVAPINAAHVGVGSSADKDSQIGSRGRPGSVNAAESKFGHVGRECRDRVDVVRGQIRSRQQAVSTSDHLLVQSGSQRVGQVLPQGLGHAREARPIFPGIRESRLQPGRTQHGRTE